MQRQTALRKYLHLSVDLMLDALSPKTERETSAETKTNVDALALASSFFSTLAETMRADNTAVLPLSKALRQERRKSE